MRRFEEGAIMIITGGCHCGNIRYEFLSDMEFNELPVRICECSYCTKHGNRYTSDPGGRLEVTIKRSDETADYHFGSKTTGSVFCTNCGVLPFMKLKTDGDLYAIININTSDQPFDMSKAQRFDYSFESVQDRVARRKKSWIGKVVIHTQD
jgi:hypothetical protein